MSKLEAIRAQRAETESEFQTVFKSLFGDSRPSLEEQTAALALHREICALYAAELSLIGSGKSESTATQLSAFQNFSLSDFPNDSPTQPVPALPGQDAPRLPLLPRLLARVTHAIQNRPLDHSSSGTP
jgi:hypothetical protein